MFLLTHEPPEPPDPEVTYLSGDIGEAVATALDAAGGKNLEILGADVAGQCLRRGLVDEILVYVLPVLLGDGIRFSPPGLARIALEPISSATSRDATILRFRVRKSAGDSPPTSTCSARRDLTQSTLQGDNPRTRSARERGPVMTDDSSETRNDQGAKEKRSRRAVLAGALGVLAAEMALRTAPAEAADNDTVILGTFNSEMHRTTVEETVQDGYAAIQGNATGSDPGLLRNSPSGVGVYGFGTPGVEGIEDRGRCVTSIIGAGSGRRCSPPRSD